MNSLDCIIIVILCISAWMGFRNGFLGYAGNRISTIVAMAVALIYSNRLALFLEPKLGIITGLTNKWTSVSASRAHSVLPGFSAANTSSKLTGIIAAIISFVLLFIITRMLFLLVWKKAGGIFSRGALKWLNRLAGLLIMLAKNAILIVVLLLVIHPLLQTLANLGIPAAGMILSYLQGSKITKLLFDIFPHIKFLPGLGV